MKTKLLIVSILILSAIWSVNAQQSIAPSPKNKQFPKNLPMESPDKYFRRPNSASKTTAVQSYWVNYGDAMNTLNPDVASFGNTYLFPDSTVKAEFGDGAGGTTLGYTWIHNISNVLDIKSQVYSDAYQVDKPNKFVAYTVDSMSLLYGYYRKHPDVNIVDTLVVYLYSNSTAANLENNSFAALDGYVDQVNVKLQKYSYTTNKPNATGITTITVPLTIDDTATTMLRFKNFAANFAVPANKLVACAMTFKPGYSYSLGDTLTLNKNYLLIRSWEENGDGTFPSYFYCDPTPYEDVCDWNLSGTVTNQVRYNTADGWNGYFIPTYAWTAAWSMEHHYISYKVTMDFGVGMKDLDFQNGIKLGQNFPNPLNNSTTIRYEIAENVNVALAVYDITGKRVMNLEQGKQPIGVHSINIDANHLHAGVYFYTLTAGQNRITKKMTVVE